MGESLRKYKCQCGREMMLIITDKLQSMTYTCPYCGKMVKINRAPKPIAVNPPPKPPTPPTPPVVPRPPIPPKPAEPAQKRPESGTVMVSDNIIGQGWTEMGRTAQAELKVVTHRALWRDSVKTYPLTGRYAWTIGREDAEIPSDIMLSGDPSISRKAAAIKVLPGKLESTYMFKVLKTKNPIYVNTRPLSDNEDVELKNGDRIKMGTCELIFSLK